MSVTAVHVIAICTLVWLPSRAVLLVPYRSGGPEGASRVKRGCEALEGSCSTAFPWAEDLDRPLEALSGPSAGSPAHALLQRPAGDSNRTLCWLQCAGNSHSQVGPVKHLP